MCGDSRLTYLSEELTSQLILLLLLLLFLLFAVDPINHQEMSNEARPKVLLLGEIEQYVLLRKLPHHPSPAQPLEA